MKKVLASVLAGSMVLGMASMASAASLVKADKKGDYDFRMVDVYSPSGESYTTYEKYEELVDAGKIPAAVQIAIDKYEVAYDAYVKAAKKAINSADDFSAINTKLVAASDALDEVAGSDPSLSDLRNDLNVPDKDALTQQLTIGVSEGYVPAEEEGEGEGAQALKGVAKFGAALAAANVKLPKVDAVKTATAEEFGVAIGVGYGDLKKAEFELEDNAGNDWNLYTFGDDDCKEVVVQVPVKKGDSLRVDVNAGKVTVSRKKAKTENGIDYYNLTIKAAAGVRDFELEDFKVEVELKDADIVFFIKGQVAYSDYQVAEPDEVLRADKKSDYTEDHLKGCIFKFDEVIDEELRIICNDYVDLLFNGNYGTDFENLRVVDDDIQEVEDFFQDYDIDYYDFVGLPKFAKDITVRVDADSDSYIYEFDKKTGDVVDITDECTYTSDGWTFKRKALKTYVVLEEPYEGGNVRAEKEPVDDEPSETEPDDTDATGSKPNPGTGAMPF